MFTTPVLKQVLQAVCWSTLVTALMSFIYLPNVLGGRADTYATVYDEYGQRTTLIFPGGHAELENCVKEKINFPDDLKQLAGRIECDGFQEFFPKMVLPRIAYSTSSSSNAQSCPLWADCKRLQILRDKSGTPLICPSNSNDYPLRECHMVNQPQHYTPYPHTYEIGGWKKCDDSLIGFRIAPAASSTNVHLHPGTVILVNKADSDILIDAYFNDMSCRSPDLNTFQSGTAGKITSRVALDRLSENKLARVYCNMTGESSGGTAYTYLFVGLNEISIDCSAPTGSKCKAPAWMNMRQDNLNEVYENGQVHCSLETQMQLCFPIITNVTTPNQTAVCTITAPDATTVKGGSSVTRSGGTTPTVKGRSTLAGVGGTTDSWGNSGTNDLIVLGLTVITIVMIDF